jgi:L-sorbose 1-phosphate reductase
MAATPSKQQAVQLVGPDQLVLNHAKAVIEPGPHQVLAKVEVVGLCFSDLKLLKQFSKHVRKSEVATGLDPAALCEMPNYVPGDKPAVPGHEAVVRIVNIGPGVTRYKPGDRYLVQTDYRWLPTASSNAAFGYNFEGALQEYVLMDERVIISPEGESMLIPVPEDLAGSALALVEPWACVENAYAEVQRRTLKDGGRLLVVKDAPVDIAEVESLPGKPAFVKFIDGMQVAGLDEAPFDDIIYFGANGAILEGLFARLAAGGLMNIVQCGQAFGAPVVVPVGRIHYGGIRIIGTTSNSPATSLGAAPASAEICSNDRINIVGAAGPMGSMHVVRALCQGIPGVEVYASDLNDTRLEALRVLAEPVAERNHLKLKVCNPSRDKLGVSFNYIVLMAPVPSLVAQAIAAADRFAIINVFAGIPAEVSAPIDLDGYVQKQLYFVGTSGSTLDDMKTVLAKVVSRQLDTNLLVAAVSGLDGAIEGIRAVEKNLMSGKIVVYPSCRGLPLQTVETLGPEMPLENGRWNKGAEEALLNLYGSK